MKGNCMNYIIMYWLSDHQSCSFFLCNLWICCKWTRFRVVQFIHTFLSYRSNIFSEPKRQNTICGSITSTGYILWGAQQQSWERVRQDLTTKQPQSLSGKTVAALKCKERACKAVSTGKDFSSWRYKDSQNVTWTQTWWEDKTGQSRIKRKLICKWQAGFGNWSRCLHFSPVAESLCIALHVNHRIVKVGKAL